MAAVGGVEVLDLGFIANEALTKFRFVKNSAAGTARTVDQADTQGEAILGVAMHDVEAADASEGAHVNVRMMGIAVIEAGGAVALLDNVTTDASGRAITAAGASGDSIHGIALQAAAGAGDLISVVLHGPVAPTAA